MTLPKLYTPVEVGQALGGISPQRVRDLVADGLLAARTRGRSLFFTEEDVQDYIERMPSVGAPKPAPVLPQATIGAVPLFERKRKRA